MGVAKNRGTPKWMVDNGKPYFLMDDLEGKHTIFRKHPHDFNHLFLYISTVKRPPFSSRQSSQPWFWLWCLWASRRWTLGNTVDGQNPANQLRLVVYPVIYRVLYIPGGAGFLPSTVRLDSGYTDFIYERLPFGKKVDETTCCFCWSMRIFLSRFEDQVMMLLVVFFLVVSSFLSLLMILIIIILLLFSKKSFWKFSFFIFLCCFFHILLFETLRSVRAVSVDLPKSWPLPSDPERS